MYGRRSGRTTRMALFYLREVIDRAGTKIEILDHYNQMSEHMRLMRMVCDMLKVLGVDHTVHENWITVYPRVK